jgi:hypothetical protein
MKKYIGTEVEIFVIFYIIHGIIPYIIHTASDLYSSPNIIWVIKSRRMRRAGHVA